MPTQTAAHCVFLGPLTREDGLGGRAVAPFRAPTARKEGIGVATAGTVTDQAGLHTALGAPTSGGQATKGPVPAKVITFGIGPVCQVGSCRPTPVGGTGAYISRSRGGVPAISGSSTP